MNIPNSARLSYRLLNDKDAQLLWELDQDETVMKYINGGKKTTLEEIHTKMLPRMQAYTNAAKGWGMWGVFDALTAEFFGWILVRPMDFFSGEPQWNNLEIGWRFKPNTWGKGIATEAAQAVTQGLIAQQSTDIDSFCAIADEDNAGSIKVMQKLGLKYVKTYLHQDPLFTTEVVYYQRDL